MKYEILYNRYHPDINSPRRLEMLKTARVTPRKYIPAIKHQQTLEFSLPSTSKSEGAQIYLIMINFKHFKYIIVFNYPKNIFLLRTRHLTQAT